MSSQQFGVVQAIACRFEQFCTMLSPIADIVLKLWIAKVFFNSGLTKIASFSTTIELFKYEYAVPILNPVFAAYMGTAAELILPALILVGLAGRLSALALFIFNIVAAISYPDISDAGIQQHITWGLMLLAIMTNTSHRLTIDYYIAKRWRCN